MSNDLTPPEEQGQNEMVVGQPSGIDNITTVQKAELPPLVSNPKAPVNLKIAPLMDVNLNVSVLLGKTMMTLGDLLKLGSGSVIELSRPTGEPVDILVNDRFFARGEIVVVEESFGVRILEVADNQRAEAA
ncbi:MAG: flagellar motor switch protein FliN [Elusimicrobiota bacterium]